MTYDQLKDVLSIEYIEFSNNYTNRQILAADDKYSKRVVWFVKTIYKVLMNQVGDETIDLLTKEEIQDIIALFNKYSNSTVLIEYD